MPAIEPDFAIADERSGRKMLKPRGPVGPAKRRGEGAVGNVQPVLMPEHRHGERGVHRLVAAGQARGWEVESTAFVTVVKTALADVGVPCLASREPDRPRFARNLPDPRGDGRRI